MVLRGILCVHKPRWYTQMTAISAYANLVDCSTH